MQIVKQYEGTEITFNEDGWFNATAVAEKFGKEAHEFLRLDSTKEYVEALKRKHGEIPYLKTKRGQQGGTWLHPKLGIKFARWCDIDFEVWADEQIDAIIRGNLDQRRLRHASAAGHKTLCSMLQIERTERGKETPDYIYQNESLLINWVLTGVRESLDRDNLTYAQLDLLARLQERDTILVARGHSYQDRKILLTAFAEDLRLPHANVALEAA